MIRRATVEREWTTVFHRPASDIARNSASVGFGDRYFRNDQRQAVRSRRFLLRSQCSNGKSPPWTSVVPGAMACRWTRSPVFRGLQIRTIRGSSETAPANADRSNAPSRPSLFGFRPGGVLSSAAHAGATSGDRIRPTAEQNNRPRRSPRKPEQAEGQKQAATEQHTPTFAARMSPINVHLAPRGGRRPDGC